MKKNWRESVRSWKVGGDFSTYPRSNILQRKTLTGQNFREPFYTLPPLKKLTVKILHCVSRILELNSYIFEYHAEPTGPCGVSVISDLHYIAGNKTTFSMV